MSVTRPQRHVKKMIIDIPLYGPIQVILELLTQNLQTMIRKALYN